MENDNTSIESTRLRRSTSRPADYRKFHLSGELGESIKGKVANVVKKLNTPEKHQSTGVRN